MQKTAINENIRGVPRAASPPTRKRPRHTAIRRFAFAGTILLLVAFWQAVVSFGGVQSFIVPAPATVVETFVEALKDGTLLKHTWITVVEAVGGLVIGLVIGISMGYTIARFPLLEDLLSPVIVAFQSTPVVAYAPLLVYWVGTGVESKIVTCILIVFFPMLMNTVVGIRNVPNDLRDLMQVSGASWWQMFTRLEIPAAMPILLTGLKTSATLSVIGAVVGEFIVADAGLGFLVSTSRTAFNTPMVYVAVFMLALVAGVLYTSVSLLERRLLAWQKRGNGAVHAL